MIEVLRRDKVSFELHYCSRTPESTAFLPELAPLAERGVVSHYFSRLARPQRLDIAGLLARTRPDSQIYCCGTRALIDAVTAAGAAGFTGRLNVEFFGSAPSSGQAAYEVRLARSGRWGLGHDATIGRDTLKRIFKAAQRLFADHGYQDTSVRAVVARARVNQAAINYHFGGKDSLLREVLRATIRALTEQQLAHAEETKEMPRENALAEFIKYQLRPLAARDELSRHFRIFNWEAVRPTAIYRKLMSVETTPFLGFAVDLMRRFMPKADQRTLTMAAIWLVGQCVVFVRNREQLANPPVSLDLDDATVEQLTALVSAWALAGLADAESKTVPAPH